MAKAKKVIGYKITVTENPTFCGIGAGGVNFAEGIGRTPDKYLANWFAEHGYEVEQIEKEETEEELLNEVVQAEKPEEEPTEEPKDKK